MQRTFSTRFALFSLALLGLIAGGCANKNSGSAKAGHAISGVSETLEELNTGKQNVNKMITSLNALKGANAGNMNDLYKTYKSDLATMKEHATEVAERSADMQKRGDQYRTYWEAEVSKMENPELRAGAEQRAAKVRAQFDGIRTKYEAARAAYKPFVKDLTDIENYLDKELSASSLSVSGPAFTKANTDGMALKAALDDLIADMVSVQVKMSPDAKN